MKRLASQIVPAATAATVAGLCVALAPSLDGTQQARAQSGPPVVCEIDGVAKDVVTARVVALDTALIANRLGAQVPGGMIYSLAGDVEPTPDSVGADPDDWETWNPGEVQLRDYKRARPIVLRVNKDQCLQITFKNLLAPPAPPDEVVARLGRLSELAAGIVLAPPDEVVARLDRFSELAAGIVAPRSGQTATRAAGVFVQGLNWASPIPGPPPDKGQDDGSWIGQNTNSLAAPGEERSYLLYAPEEGPFLLYSTADDFVAIGATDGGFGAGGQLTQGLFGAVVVQPELAEYYRSQINREDLCLASTDGQWDGNGCERANPAQPPQIDYQVVYPAGHPREGRTILNIVQDGELVHSDLTAIIAGPSDIYGQPGMFPADAADQPVFHDVAQTPNRREPYREFTIVYHELLRSVQAFAELHNDRQLGNLLESGGDNFAINYGMGGIGSAILANRLAVGPTRECTDCKYEEFFLSSPPNGDPATIVDNPADTDCTQSDPNDFTTYSCSPTGATRAYYPDDPSNVYHGYLWDHTKFRILHGGVDLHHLHHLHAHQWQRSPNSSSSHYLDSQAIGPGSAFTLETVFNGGGNKNLTVGDSIFHCHFYPHFAAGMWALWRVHDVFEEGTELTGYPQGRPTASARALPDGEITTGTPIPAIVPLPTKAMAPMPAPVRLTNDGTQIEVCQGDQSSPTNCISNLAAAGGVGEYDNPGFPFFIPSIAGSRATHPPLDFALACSVSGEACDTAGAACAGSGGMCEPLDGGLPRHIVEPGGDVVAAALNPLDFSKDVETASAIGLPEQGTLIEQAAMNFHMQRTHPSVTPTGAPVDFVTNGRPPVAGAPYADPCIDINGEIPTLEVDGEEKEVLNFRDYWAVDIQTNATYNKEGWHYPQQRMISLWGDAWDFLGIRPNSPQKPPQPLFFRANSFDCVRYRLANLVPKSYELDDFQVRTPTDVLGQHIHLVKFDVTSSDGAANGYNYEDGTLAPDEVIERINAFNNGEFRPTFGAPPQAAQLEPKFIEFFGADPGCAAGDDPDAEKCACELVSFTDDNGETHFSVQGGRWCGAQATFQRWYVDPQLTDTGTDKTMRTVFTHDHFSPSTHQQAGLYAGLVAEPFESTWRDNQNGSVLGNRTASQNGVNLNDGGPTSWQAVIETDDDNQSYREFLLAFQDTALMYRPFQNIAAPACPEGVSCGFCSNDHNQVCVTDAASNLHSSKVCQAVDLPNPFATPPSSSTLQPSCNFIAGIPSKNSLFFTDGTANSNIWGLTAPDPLLDAVGWDTLPIDPGSFGLFVPGIPRPIQGQAPQPELISFNGSTSSFTLNYRNEPLFPRIHSTSADPNADNLSYAYASLDRQLPGGQPPPYAEPLTPGVEPGDPFTPLLRAYAGDDVQIRTLVGAHQNPHNFTLHGNNWLYEPANPNSGWRSTQTMGLSEHFELLFQLLPELEQPDAQTKTEAWTDYLYKSTAAKQGQESGNWGILRAYGETQNDLHPLPQNDSPPSETIPICPADLLEAECTEETRDGFFASPPNADGHRLRCYSVVATSVADIGFNDNALSYNTVFDYNTPNALIYLHLQDYQKLRANPPQSVPGFTPAEGLAEPLVLRAAAGDCIKVDLSNRITDSTTLGPAYRSGQLPVAGQAADRRNLYVESTVSRDVGLRPQLVAHEAAQSDGTNVGFNPSQTAAPNSGEQTYWWYAGNIDPAAPSGQQHIPIEFGATNLMPSDPINHHEYGLFGALIIEPEHSVWLTDPNSRTSATVYDQQGNLLFRDFVAIFQDDIFMLDGNGERAGGVGAINYRIEKPGDRDCPDDLPIGDVSCVLSDDAQCNDGQCGFSAQVPIQTPLFCARKGHETRFRLLHPGGAVTNQVFELHGHPFPEEPYVTAAANCPAPPPPGVYTPVTHTNVRASQTIGVANQCPDGDVAIGPTLSEWKAARMGHGPSNHYDVVVETAGGANFESGDFLYRTYPAQHFRTGIWGIFRVTGKDPSDVPERCPTFLPAGQLAGLESEPSSEYGLASAPGEIPEGATALSRD